MHFLTWTVSLSAIDGDLHNLCLLAAIDTASAIYESKAQGMVLWPYLITAVILGFFFVCL